MNRSKLREQLIRHEGLRLKPYRCPSGYLTIGVGRNLETKGLSKKEILYLLKVQGISREIALYLLDNDIEYFIERTRDLFPNFDDLTDVRQRVFVDMCFNLGYRGLSGFYDLRKAVQDEDYVRAAQAMLDSRWATQVGQRAIELANMMIKG